MPAFAHLVRASARFESHNSGATEGHSNTNWPDAPDHQCLPWLRRRRELHPDPICRCSEHPPSSSEAFVACAPCHPIVITRSNWLRPAITRRVYCRTLHREACKLPILGVWEKTPNDPSMRTWLRVLPCLAFGGAPLARLNPAPRRPMCHAAGVTDLHMSAWSKPNAPIVDRSPKCPGTPLVYNEIHHDLPLLNANQHRTPHCPA